MLLFLLRLSINPVIDAFAYGRLGQSTQPLWRPFIKLYVMLYLGVVLLGWVIYLAASWLLQLLTLHPLIFLSTTVALFFGLTLWLSLYKARLAVAAQRWPKAKVWLRLALARLIIISLTGGGSFLLQTRATHFTGWKLGATLFLVELLFIWARLWQSSCAIEAANQAS